MADGARIDRPAQLRTLLILAIVAMAARAITLGNPIVHTDEEFYFTVARAMASGALPYVDIWDRKPIGLFLLYLPAASLPLPLAIYAYQATALAFTVATAWCITRLAAHARWAPGGPLAAIAYILWLNLADGQGAQAPVLYGLPMAAAALLIAGERGASPARGIGAMLLAGIALQIKYSVVFEGVFFGLWSVAMHRRAGNRPIATLGYAAVLVAVALAPTLLAAASYGALGHFPEFWEANVLANVSRRSDPAANTVANLARIALILSPLVAMAATAFARSRRERMPLTRTFLFGWLAAAIAGVLLFGGWLEHYALPVMLPAAACAAGALGDPKLRRWALPILAVVAIGGQVLLLSKRAGRGTPAQFRRLAAAVGSGPGCLYVESGSTMLYAWTGRCRVSRYVFPGHIARTRETNAVGIDQRAELVRILAHHPAVIVMRPPYPGERPDIRALTMIAVRRGYTLRAALPMGRETVRVFAATRP